MDADTTSSHALYQFLSNSDTSFQTKFGSVFITPKMSQTILDSMSKPNRPESRTSFRKFTKKMLSGEWVDNHPEGLMFDSNRKLHEGYGRMKALASLDGQVNGFWFLIQRNVAPNVEVNKDIRPRSASDLYVFLGGLWDKNTPPKKLVAISKMALQGLYRGTIEEDEKRSVALAIKHGALFHQLYHGASSYAKKTGGKKTGRYHVGWIGAFARAALCHGETNIMAQFNRFIKQEWISALGDDDPLKRLHFALSNFDPGSPGYNVYPYAVSAVRAACENRSLGILQAAKTDFPLDTNDLKISNQ